MFSPRPSLLVLAAFLSGACTSGCFSNKNKEVAGAQAPPPPSAYPTGTAAHSGEGATASAINPVASAPQPPAAPAPFQLREGEKLVTHQIESGETLSSIAAKYSTSIGRIQAANGMTDARIFAGKSLQVPTLAMVPNLAMNPAGGGASSYPGQSPQSPPTAPVPQSQQSSVNPASTSYPRQDGIPAPTQPAGSFPTPSFQGSQIQFSN